MKKQNIKNVQIVEQAFIVLSIVGVSLVSDCIKCVSLENRPCQAKLTLVDVNSNEPHYYLFTVSVNKCGVMKVVKLLVIHKSQYMFYLK